MYKKKLIGIGYENEKGEELAKGKSYKEYLFWARRMEPGNYPRPGKNPTKFT